MNEHLTLEQRLHNALACQEVEKLQSIHSYLHGRGYAKEEWENIWAQNNEVSWAHSFGRMRGFASVWFGSVGEYDAQSYRNYLDLFPVYPQVIGKDPRPIHVCPMHTTNTGVIEVAEDGKTARATFFTPGIMFSTLNPERKKWSNYLWERYGADFVYEDGRWLFLHEQVCPDFMGTTDFGNCALAEVVRLQKHEAEQELHVSCPPVEDPGPLHYPSSPVQPLQNTVPFPTPYRTMDDENTFTPSR